MERAILISIKPKWCKKIAEGEKTIEVRKTFPKLTVPFKCYIYCTRGVDHYHYGNKFFFSGKVIGEFICDGIIDLHDHGDAFIAITDIDLKGCCLNYNQLHNYANGKPLYGWHISELKIYDEPKELSEFTKYNRSDCEFEHLPFVRPNDCTLCVGCKLEKPPQSWCYVEV